MDKNVNGSSYTVPVLPGWPLWAGVRWRGVALPFKSGFDYIILQYIWEMLNMCHTQHCVTCLWCCEKCVTLCFTWSGQFPTQCFAHVKQHNLELCLNPPEAICLCPEVAMKVKATMSSSSPQPEVRACFMLFEALCLMDSLSFELLWSSYCIVKQ